jgi:hypothetical protein
MSEETSSLKIIGNYIYTWIQNEGSDKKGILMTKLPLVSNILYKSTGRFSFFYSF